MTPKHVAANKKPDVKRSVLRTVESDHDRVRVILAAHKLTWQQMLTEAVNGWLKKHGEKGLEELP